MKLLNYKFISTDDLEQFIKNNKIKNTNAVLIQLFYSNVQIEKVYSIKSELLKHLSNASLIGTSTAGIIKDGHLIDDEIIISFSIFEQSITKSSGYCSLDMESIVNKISKDLLTNKTKLLVIFANTYRFDPSTFLEILTKRFPKLTISGGNSGDGIRYKKCEVFSSQSEDSDVVIAAVDSDVLQVETKYLLNWQTIGQEMTVTKAIGNRIYEINNIKILDLYKHYLGSEVSENILKYGLNFPLIYTENGVNICRGPIINNDDGSVIFGGIISENTRVKFGYANINYIDDYTQNKLLNEVKYQSEAIYIYSCASRKTMLGNYLNEELSTINQIAPTTGFITYGEFYHNTETCSNNLLNITTTYVLLNEKDKKDKIINNKKLMLAHENDIALKALSTLVSRTSEDFDENVNYLKQFTDTVNSLTIFSTTDEKGIITGLNKNFERISGYTREELIGQSHNIVRHKDTPPEVFEDLWKTIKAGKKWKSIVKNKRKDGSAYFVLAEVVPIYNKDKTLKEYISIRTDVTTHEQNKLLLSDKLDVSKKDLENNINYSNQYENALNTTTAILKTDTNNVIKFANKKFCEISEYKLEELVGLDLRSLLHEKYSLTNVYNNIDYQLSKKETVEKILTYISKNKKERILSILFYPILDKEENVIEHLHIMHDITEVIKLNEEIVNTQKEVVLTMGAIGETRSKETGLHVRRVAEYSYILAKLAGLDEENASLLKQASPMHDIGKVAIPDNILNKPGKLTKEEFDIMKTHASLGYEMLKYSDRPILKTSAIVAYSHHEKWDGSGYPNGLKGEDIPLVGRLTAVADVFDALGHDRCYKKAWLLEEILDLFRQESGKHFDPNLINLFLNNLDKFLEIQKEFVD